MIDADNLPYGALYSFQPDYLEHLNHDEIYLENEHHEMEVPTPTVWEIVGSHVKAFFIKS